MRLENGFVKIEGSSDLEDSSMAAGMCVLFDYPIEVDLRKYIKPNGMYQRCNNSKYLFSRDQTICLVAGLSKVKLGLHSKSNLWRVDGKDWFSPANKGHIRRCDGLKASWFQDLWLKAEIMFHAKFTPLDEPNQLICMMLIAKIKYLKLWVRHNKKWRESIRTYWEGWRNEPYLSHLMIEKIEQLTKQKRLDF